MSIWKSAAVLSVALIAAGCSQSSVSPSAVSSASTAASTELNAQGLRLSATLEFGNPNTGSPFSPASGHDQSLHAPDTLVPQTVVIDAGGTVTFKTYGPHQVAVYDDGVGAGDIDTTILTGGGAGCPPPPLINDPNGRLAVLAAQPCAGGTTTPQYTFTEPGRYLVICTFLPHFTIARMYGWVVVRARP